jgi:hypothetical protein
LRNEAKLRKESNWLEASKQKAHRGESLSAARANWLRNEPKLPPKSVPDGVETGQNRVENGVVVYNCGSAGDSRHYKGAIWSVAPYKKPWRQAGRLPYKKHLADKQTFPIITECV